MSNNSEIFWNAYGSSILLPEFRGELAVIISFRFRDENPGTQSVIPYFDYKENFDALNTAFIGMFGKKRSGLIYMGINDDAIRIITETIHLSAGTNPEKRMEKTRRLLEEKLIGCEISEPLPL